MKRRGSRASVNREVKGLRARIKATETQLARLLTELKKAKALLAGKAQRR